MFDSSNCFGYGAKALKVDFWQAKDDLKLEAAEKSAAGLKQLIRHVMRQKEFGQQPGGMPQVGGGWGNPGNPGQYGGDGQKGNRPHRGRGGHNNQRGGGGRGSTRGGANKNTNQPNQSQHPQHAQQRQQSQGQ